MDEMIRESEEFPLRAIHKFIRGFEGELDEINNSNDRLVMFCSILYNLVAAFGTWTDTMQLVCEGVYIMFERNKVDLLRRPSDICSAPGITESFMQLANLLKSTVRDIHDKSISSDPPSNVQRDWKRPSAAVPERTTERTKPSSSPSPSPSTSSSSSSSKSSSKPKSKK
jgi:hypothetical protein